MPQNSGLSATPEVSRLRLRATLSKRQRTLFERKYHERRPRSRLGHPQSQERGRAARSAAATGGRGAHVGRLSAGDGGGRGRRDLRRQRRKEGRATGTPFEPVGAGRG